MVGLTHVNTVLSVKVVDLPVTAVLLNRRTLSELSIPLQALSTGPFLTFSSVSVECRHIRRTLAAIVRRDIGYSWLTSGNTLS